MDNQKIPSLYNCFVHWGSGGAVGGQGVGCADSKIRLLVSKKELCDIFKQLMGQSEPWPSQLSVDFNNNFIDMFIMRISEYICIICVYIMNIYYIYIFRFYI